MRAAWTLGLLLALPAEAGRRKDAAPAGPTVVPAQGLSLRNAFDTDPSRYIGRFLPDDLPGPVDETAAMPSACSRFITARTVDAGGVVYDEVFSASSEAAARAGVPAVLGAGLDASFGSLVRVHYTLTRKLVAEIADPASFAACCAEAPGQCTGRFIGEFLEGTGEVSYATGREGGGELDATAGGLEVQHGVAWRRSIQFPSPVYFAMKTTRNAYASDAMAPPEGGCGPWTESPPRSAQGQYFVGVSALLDAEHTAREAALLDARVQVVRWLGESISTGTLRVETTTGSGAGLTTALQQRTTVQAAAAGVATYVKDQAWCVQAIGTPAGYRYVAKVLAFLPDSDDARAAEAVIGAAP
ncbi:MAG: hypothetical protein ABIO70_20655 [Pseudomonadota bacterium]